MSFYVTLPSNSSMDYYDNTVSNFTTHLSIPIQLNGPNEVGLVEITYDHCWEIDLGYIKYMDLSKNVFKIPIVHLDGDSFSKLFTKINKSINTKNY